VPETVPSTSSAPFPTSPPRAWAEVNLQHLRHNLSVARQHKHGFMGTILKAEAYGHGSIPVAQFLESLPESEAPRFFGVASVIEARRLADAGIKTPISLLGPTSPVERAEIIARRWICSIANLKEATHLNKLTQELSPDQPLTVHLTVDTGMGRGGFLPKDLPEVMPALQKLSHLNIQGIGSHLPSADEDESFTLAQYELFDSVVESLGIEHFKYRHLENSAGILLYQSRTTNLYRPGLMLYGISPIPDFQHELKPVMTLKSRVSLVRTLPAGQGISYGRDVILEKESRVATIGIGYADGYPHALSNKGAEVLIHGTRCPVLGRVTMDQIMVDVSQLEHCESGDIVELFGANILASELAELAGTIPWAIFTGITPRVSRIYSGM